MCKHWVISSFFKQIINKLVKQITLWSLGKMIIASFIEKRDENFLFNLILTFTVERTQSLPHRIIAGALSCLENFTHIDAINFYTEWEW